MPLKRINFERLQKLRRNWAKIRPNFEKLKSLDWRKGSLVREAYGLAVKKVHGATAQQTIDKINGKVAIHNQSHKPLDYELLQMHAIALDKQYIAMPRIRAHTIADILEFKTEKAAKFFSKMKKTRHVTEKQLRKAYERANENSGNFFFMPDLLLVGYKKGRFQFMPTIDLH